MYDDLVTAAMLSLFVGIAFMAAWGIVAWLAEFVMFAVHLWRTR